MSGVPPFNGAGNGPAGLWNKLVISPGQELSLGTSGGVLLLSPPGGAPGSMTFVQMQNKVWHLLRENGPYTGYPAPTNGDFSQQVVQDDLNIALAQFVADTGIAPDLTDRMDTFPVFAVLDYPLPPGLVSLTRVEYTPLGEQTYVLLPKSMSEFDQVTGGIIPNDQGQPYYYRQPWAGYIRLSPQPSLGNAQGGGSGAFTVGGVPASGQSLLLTFANPGYATVTVGYSVSALDTLATIAYNLASAINLSSVVLGPNPFLAQAVATSNVVNLTSLTAPGTNITYAATTSAGAVLGIEGGGILGIEGGGAIGISPGAPGLVVLPQSATPMTASGDLITFYYSSLGTVLSSDGDVPGIPPQYHVALVYRVLADYWERKQDPGQAKSYMQKYLAAVKMAKAFTFDSNRATQPTIGGDLDEDAYRIGGW